MALKVLIIEDNVTDAEIIQRIVTRHYNEADFTIIMTKTDFIIALENFKPDIILSDNALPAFNAMEALDIIKHRSLHIPFILVTGTVSEEFAVMIIKAGADDYLLKDRLARLPAAIDAALDKKRSEKQKQEADEKLKENESKYRKAQALGKMGHWELDIKNNLLTWSDEIFIIFDKPVTDYNPGVETFLDIVHPDDRQIFLKAQQKALAGEEALNISHRIVHRDNSVKYVHEIGELVYDAEGKPAFLNGTVQDITERRLAEQKLIMSEQQLQGIYNTVSDIIFLLSVEDGNRYKFISVNNSFLKTTGLKKEQVIGQYADAVIPAGSWPYVSGKYRQALATKKTVSWEEISEYPAGIKVGLVTVTPVLDTEEKPFRLVGSVHDITERKKAEEALKSSENFLRTIVQTEPECIKLLNAKGEIEEMNPAGLAIIEADSLEEVKGKYILSIIDEDSRPAFVKLINNVFEGTGGQLQYRITGLKGTRRWLDIHAVPLKNVAGDIISFLGVTRDITERKKTEEELKTTNEELHYLSSHLQNIREEERMQIARDIHDELGQQLTGLKMDVSQLRKKLNSTDDTIQQRIGGIMSLIDETVQSVRKIASNLRPSILDDLGLVAALEWHSEEVQKRYGIPIFFSTSVAESHLPEALVTGLFRIYQETLTNVVRHSQAGRVTSNLHQNKTNLILSVADDGKGIDPHVLQNGKTWGLIGIKERTYLLGGQYELDSEPGKGTLIKVTVPFNQEN